MEKLQNCYETLFVVTVASGEELTRAAIDKFTGIIAASGTIEQINEWGKRRLAYPINDMPEGYYVLVTFKSEPEFPTELERLFGIDDAVIRSTVIRLNEKQAAKALANQNTTAPEVVISIGDDDAPEAPAPVAAPAAEAAPAEAVAEAPAQTPAEEPAAEE